MTYDDILTLVKTVYSADDLGVERKTETRKPVYCYKKSVGSRAFNKMRQEGLKPALVFVIHRFEYEGEETAIFNGRHYKIIRTYETGVDEIELTAEAAGGDE